VAKLQTLEVPVKGMDCAECAQRVQHAIARLPGVESVNVLLATEKAILQLDPDQVDVLAIREAVASAGDYSVPETTPSPATPPRGDFNRQLMLLLAGVFSVVVSIVIVGEWLGMFEILNELVPFPIGVAIILVGGWPVFRSVIRAALKRQITSHTLMTIGAVAALAVGEWVTAAIVVVFMRAGVYVENFTTESARRAVKELTAIAPQTARVERDGAEVEVPVAEVKVGEIVIVRPGEKIPIDGEVIAGQATIDQATITGESMPVEVASGSYVFAATIAKLGSVRVKTHRIGADTTFGRVIKMVEEAEAHRADVQRFADKFSAYYLPIVAGLAALTFLISRNPLSTAAVLVVACSCSFALATPVAMLASIGGSAKRGLIIKGSKYLETLARADVVLVDKTGTLTLGQPQITDVIPFNGLSASEVLTLAASAERYSEHPLAEAVRVAARAQNLPLSEPQNFEAIPGMGIRAQVNGSLVLCQA
jgi:Cd2+/Zn2+-exporting ATPase/Cu+-exporting ATPase